MKKIALSLLFSSSFMLQMSAQIADSSCFIITNKGEITYADSLTLVEESLKAPYLLVDGSHKYGLHELTCYSSKAGYYRRFIDSVVNFPLWYKREVKGKINFYSKPLAEYVSGTTVNMLNGGTYHSSIYTAHDVFYTQVGDEAPQKLTYSNLQILLKSNKRSLNLLKKGHQLLNIRRGLTIGGTAALLFGGSQTLKKARENNLQGKIKISPLVFIGLAAIVIPFKMVSAESKYRKAVEVFNQ
jgi:hypothetical protein